MGIRNNILDFTNELSSGCRLVAVSKTQPVDLIQEAYDAGQRIFAENKVQELVEKHGSALPRDIEWHMIGHLQRNKVKYIAPFVSLIHSVDSTRLLEEINRQGQRMNRVIPCLAQIFIAREESKFGFSKEEFLELINLRQVGDMGNIVIKGLMGMATLTDNVDQIRSEFGGLKDFFNEVKAMSLPLNVKMEELSIGMSSDYKIALECGSTLIRIGTAIFGERNYQK